MAGRGGAPASVVAGVRVTDGALTKAATFRVRRGKGGGDVVWEGGATSLRRHKLDVDRVGAGSECGVLLDGFTDVREGDTLEAVTTEYVATTAASVLEGSPASGGGGGGVK
jgi:translation initiation factor IF-2